MIFCELASDFWKRLIEREMKTTLEANEASKLEFDDGS